MRNNDQIQHLGFLTFKKYVTLGILIYYVFNYLRQGAEVCYCKEKNVYDRNNWKCYHGKN